MNAKVELETDGQCDPVAPHEICCSFDTSTKDVKCFYCCDKRHDKQAFICSYKRGEGNIGRVGELRAAFIGNTSIQIQWSSPSGVAWVFRDYRVEWKTSETSGTDFVKSTEFLMERLEYGMSYLFRVFPSGSKMDLRGEESAIEITTLDPRPSIGVKIQSSGAAMVHALRYPRGLKSTDIEVDVAVSEIDPSTRTKKPVTVIRGQAAKTELTGLKPGAEYFIEMTPVKVGDEKQSFNYSTTFKAFPSCAENQIQEGFLCIWTKNESKSWKEASEICQGDNGELLDYKTQKELTPTTKALLTSYIKKDFWVDVSGSRSSAAIVDGTDGKCEGGENSDVMCCSYQLSSEGLMDVLKCACCDEPQPFSCKISNKVDLGNIGRITVGDVTSTSLRLEWTMESDTNWQKPSFLVTWQTVLSDKRRKKRSVEDYVMVKDAQTTLTNLVPSTNYSIAVAPYSDSAQIEGPSTEVIVTTRDNDVMVAGITQKSGCTMTILKMFCCITVILGTGFKVFVSIATRILYLDCLAQIFGELSLLGAYLCILVSSSQSYSVDNECLRAGPTLCIAVSALIQFFFQAVFLFMLLESVLMCFVLKDYLPDGCSLRSPISLMIVGFGIPAVMNIVLAAIASDNYTDLNDNCWLNLNGSAMLPSVIPVIICGATCLFLLLSVFDADEPKENVSPIQFQRGKVFLKMRWACFAILCLVTVSYGTGMVGASNRDSTLNYVFVGFSTALGVLIPFFRIRCDDEVREQLQRGLFNSLRDDLGGIRVTPAPEADDSNSFLNMADLSNTKYKQQQLDNFRLKREKSLANADFRFRTEKSFADANIAWHR